MRRLLSFLLFVVVFLWSITFFPDTSSSSSDDVPNESDLLEQIYAPFDSLHTDIDDYIWPTDASTAMTSGFADFRTTHFHGGIDISTRGVKGFKVFAARDGYVARVRVSPFGYGKMLYVRHADGFTTTYAHLQKFNDNIEQHVRTVQIRNESYPVDIRLEPDQFPVAKGDLIAYTGDTGVGPPHLHFEVRDADLNIVNPLLFPAIVNEIKDESPPVFEQIAFSPLSFESSVQSDFQPWRESVRQTKPGRYLLPRVMHVRGAIGVSVKAYDRTDGSWHRTGVNAYELYVDSLLIFSSRLHRIPHTHSKQVSLHYDWALWYEGKGRFQKLYVDAGNKLPLYNRAPEGAGVIDTQLLEPGFHELRIVARDMKGNASELHATFVVNHPPEFELKSSERKLYVMAKGDSPLHALTVSSKNRGGKNWSTKRVLASALASTEDGYELPVGRSYDVIRVVAEGEDGGRSYPQFYFASPTRSSNTSLTIEKKFFQSYAHIVVTSHLPLTLRPSMWLTSGGKREYVELFSLDANKYVAAVPLSMFGSGLAQLTAEADVNGTNVIAYDDFSIFPISPSEGGTIVAGDGEFTITFPSNGVYQPLYCRVEKNEFGYSVYPKDILLNRGAMIEYRPSSAGVQGKTGLYANVDGSWDLLRPADPEDPYVFTARVTRFLGDFAVLTDVFSPTISDINARYSGKRLSLRFRLYDNLSGVASESLRVTLNDQFLIAEYDPYNRRVTVDEPITLPKGFHRISIEVADKMGNRSVAQKNFRVQ